MLDMYFVSLYVFFSIASWFLLRLAGEKPNNVSLVNITAVAIYVFSIVGVIPLYFGLDTYHVDYLGVTDQALILKLLVVSSVNLMAFLMGVVYVRRVLFIIPLKIKSRVIHDLNQPTVVALKILLIVCVVVLGMYLSKSSGIALFEAIRGDASAATLARSEMTSGFDGRYFLYALFFQEIGLFLLLVAYSRYLAFGRGRAFFITMLLFYITVAMVTAQKAPVAYMVIYLTLTFYTVRKNAVMPPVGIIKIGVVLLLLLGAVFYLFVGFDNIIDAINAVLMRAFAGSISPGYYYLQYYPEYQEFLLGRTVPNPFGIFGYTVSNYIVEVFDFIDPSLSGMGIIGTAPIVFWGEVYANFGLLAIPFIAFIIGSILAVVAYFVSRLVLNPVTIGYSVWLISHFIILSVNGFSYYVYDVFFWVITFIVLMLLTSNGRLRIRSN